MKKRSAEAAAALTAALSSETIDNIQRMFHGFSHWSRPNPIPRHHRRRSKYTPHQGKKECERRRRQMARAA